MRDHGVSRADEIYENGKKMQANYAENKDKRLKGDSSSIVSSITHPSPEK